MPKSDSWSDGIAIESLSNMDSAGSYESVISMNSTYSEDSMDYLSAEERACLMYLEETIEALEVQEDSGLSNDEPDLGLQEAKIGQRKVNDTSNFMSVGRLGRVEHHTLYETSETNSRPVSETNTKDPLSSLNLETQPKPLVTGFPSSAPSTKVLCVTTDANGNPKIVTSTSLPPDQSSKASEPDPSLIPPPSDFMDEPHPLAHPKEIKDFPPSADISNRKSVTTINLEQLRQRAFEKKTSSSPSVPSPELSPCQSPLAIASGYLMSPPPDPTEPRSPPAVAPKPKKLPANIQKSPRSPRTASDSNTGHLLTTSNDPVLLDHQRVHMEALRKLGLLKSDEAVSGPTLSPKFSASPSHSPTTRRSWGAPPSPFSPPAQQTPPLSSSNTYVNSPPPVFVPLQSLPTVSPSVNSLSPDILPAPAAFSDPADSLPVHGETAVKDGSKDNVDMQANMPHLNSPTLTKQLTPPKIKVVKSATLERSGLGLSSSTASQDFSNAGQLRKSRPRPASLGSGKEFSSSQGEHVQTGHATIKEQDSPRSLHVYGSSQHSRDSHKLPRSEGISVLICPRSENEEDRRKALKKLGLLRD